MPTSSAVPPNEPTKTWSSIKLGPSPIPRTRTLSLAQVRLPLRARDPNVQAWVDSLTSMIKGRLGEGYDLYVMTFMFRPLPPSAAAHIMARIVEETHRKLHRRLQRYTRSALNRTQPFTWIGFPDFPVYKRRKISLPDAATNDGRHVHVLALVPPFTRLRRPFPETVTRNIQHLLGPELQRLHVVPIDRSPEVAVGYFAKSLLRGRIDYDDVIFLPPSGNELSPRGQHPNRGRQGQVRRAPPV